MHSVTGVPQALSYLIDDVGRRYGVLRLGKASTYLRSDDPALIDQAVAEASALGIPLRRLAPTVAISTVAMPGADDPAADRRAGARRGGRQRAGARPAAAAAAAPSSRRRSTSTGASRRSRDEQLESLITGCAAPTAPARCTRTATAPAGDTMARAARRRDHRKPVWIGYVDAEGGTSHRMIEPVAMSSGAVVAYDRLRGAVRTFVLHRITGVRPVSDDELDAETPNRPVRTAEPERPPTEMTAPGGRLP